MIQRCTNPLDQAWADYGGRGIGVADAWRKSFLVFLSDMGPPPSPEHSIDRVNNDGNYEPDNCRWATKLEQANNTRSNVWLTAFGETKTIAQWVRDSRCRLRSKWGLSLRIRRGIPPEIAIVTGPRPGSRPRRTARRAVSPT